MGDSSAKIIGPCLRLTDDLISEKLPDGGQCQRISINIQLLDRSYILSGNLVTILDKEKEKKKKNKKRKEIQSDLHEPSMTPNRSLAPSQLNNLISPISQRLYRQSCVKKRKKKVKEENHSYHYQVTLLSIQFPVRQQSRPGSRVQALCSFLRNSCNACNMRQRQIYPRT